MRLDYKILWIEDDESWLESIIDDIETYLEERGFNLIHERIEKYESKDFSLYDLIAVDLSLSEEKNGAEAIETIRDNNNFYTEILFYSQSGEKKLRKELQKKNVDGVYCASREDFPKKIQKLIDTTIRKTQEINNLRGLVMAEEAELQMLTEKVLLIIHSKKEIADFIKKSGYGYVKGFLEDKSKEFKKINPDTDYEKLFDMPIYGAHGKMTTLHQFLKEDINKDGKFIPTVSVMNDYTVEVIQMRNNLAHSVEEERDGKIILINHKGVEREFTETDFRKIRKDIKKHKKNLNQILTLIA